MDSRQRVGSLGETLRKVQDRLRRGEAALPEYDFEREQLLRHTEIIDELQQREAAERCQNCCGAGFVRRDVPPLHPDFGKVFPCSVCGGRKHRTIEERARSAGLSNEQIAMTFETWSSSYQPNLAPVKTFVQGWAKAPVVGVVLVGSNGVGKTHLAAAAALAMIEAGLGVAWYEARELVRQLRDSVGDGTVAEFVRWLRDDVGVLVLDDWGAEHASEFSSDAVEEVLASRSLAHKPFLITTNDGPKKWGDRLASRFSDKTRVRVVACEGDDVRPKLGRLV